MEEADIPTLHFLAGQFKVKDTTIQSICRHYAPLFYHKGQCDLPISPPIF